MKTTWQDEVAFGRSRLRFNREPSLSGSPSDFPCATLLLALAGCLTLMALTGCSSAARSLGKFPIDGTFGEKAIGYDGYPLDPRLYVDALPATVTVQSNGSTPTTTEFSAADLVNLASLAEKLKKPVRVFDIWFEAQLSADTKAALKDHHAQGSDPARLQKAILKELNRLLLKDLLYEQTRFSGIELRSDTSSLMSQKPQGNELRRLNRLLIEDAYPQEVSRYQSTNTTNKVPLVKVAYRSPWSGKLVNPDTEEAKHRSKQDYYMVIDVTNLRRYPALGAVDNNGTFLPDTFKARLRVIAEMLLMAADANGEVYWRHLTTFLKTKGAIDSAAQAGLGAGIAAGFINPVVGASIAGAALVVDTAVSKFTSGLDVGQYAALREAASTWRVVLKGKLFEAIDGKAVTTTNTTNPVVIAGGLVNDVLRFAYDYAFTYSIDGAIHAAQKQNAELKSLLVGGTSEWSHFFRGEIERREDQLFQQGKLKGEDLARYQKKHAVKDQDENTLIAKKKEEEKTIVLRTTELETKILEQEAKNDELRKKRSATDKPGEKEQPSQGSPLFSEADFTNLPSLASKLNHPTRPFDKWLVDQLAAETKAALASYQPATPDQDALKKGLVRDFNAIPQCSLIDDLKQLAGIDLRPQTKDLCSKNPRGDDLRRAIRLLIEDAYPLEVARRPQQQPKQ